MIISYISGGLGNQLFQYATGRCLADLNNTELKLDVSSFESYQLRNFDLNAFNLRASFATPGEITRLIPSHNFEKAFQYLSPLKKRKYYREKYFHFDDAVLKLGMDVYLKGYFQSEKYFLPIKEKLRNDFSIKKEKPGIAGEFKSQLRDKNSIAVHIRRGDFSKDDITMHYHGTLPADYYHHAIRLIQSKLPNPHFYFFSDDIQWVKENLQVPGAVYVSGEITKNHIEDLYLMSQCRHNIIANSSFSWWGAWLNNNPDKIVIAPKKWFNKGPKDTQDLIPEGWIKI